MEITKTFEKKNNLNRKTTHKENKNSRNKNSWKLVQFSTTVDTRNVGLAWPVTNSLRAAIPATKEEVNTFARVCLSVCVC